MMTLVSLSGISMLSVNMFLPSLVHIAEDFAVDYSVATLSIAAYLGLTVILHLVMGPLSDFLGRRPIVLTALVIFIIASIGCALAETFTTFLAFRLLQSAIVVGVSLTPAIIRDTHPPQEAASKIGYVNMAWAIAPMLGPLLGGTLDELFGWRANFYAFSAFGAAILLLAWFDLSETHKHRSSKFLDQIAAYPDLLSDVRFWNYALCMTFSVGAFYVFITGAPLVAQQILQLSPAELGICIGSITAGFVVGNFISGRIAAKVPLTTMMLSGRIVGGTGLIIGLAVVALGGLNVWTLFGSTVFVGIGNGLTMPSASSGAISVQPKLAGSITGLSSAILVTVAAILTVLTGLVISEKNGAYTLLGMMLACVAVSTAAALNARRLEKSD
ncbi:MAG: multidrug effflux MFS transporter [Pseudomonadota bacterium]